MSPRPQKTDVSWAAMLVVLVLVVLSDFLRSKPKRVSNLIALRH
jgi:hypothetical protein